MAENMIKFLRGNVANLPATATAGAVYFTKDEGLYLGLEDGTYHRYGDFITVDNVASLPAEGAHETCMYYCVAENVLAKWSGTEWIQINKQKTLAELGGVAKSVYEAKVAALEKADTDNATAISNLTTYVGTIPEDATSTDIVGYVKERTDGIATDSALQDVKTSVALLDSRVTSIADSLAADGPVTLQINAIDKKAQAAQDTADSKTTMAEVEAKNYATKTEAQGYADAKDEAINAAQARADEAYTLADGKATMAQVNEAIAGAGHAVKSEVDKAISDMDAAYKAADTALETKLQGNIDKKVDQSAYDTKIAELAGADTTLQGNIDAEATARKNADDAQIARIETLEGQITGLSGAMHFKGVETEIPENTEGYVDGDVIIVGDKEYVFNGGAFVEFGDVSAEGDRISAIETIVGKEAEGENPATGLIKDIADNAAAIAAEKTRAEEKEAELAQADATNLQAAKDYADDAVEALGIGDYVKKADADAAYAPVGHNHDDKYDAKGDAAAAETAAKSYADGLKATIDAAYAAEDTKLSNRIKDLEDNKAGYATTAQVATAKAEAISEAATDAANKDAVVLAEAQKASTAVQTALDTYKTANDAEVAKKANSADVYTKSEVYTKTETYTKAEVEAMLTWSTF